MCNVIDLKTQGVQNYLFFPVSSSSIRFKVKAGNDAHIALTNGPCESDTMTELLIGGWDNTRTVIRRDRDDNNKAEAMTWQILMSEQYVGIWLRWYNNIIAAGLEGSNVPFIQYLDLNPHPIDHVGVRTGWGSHGHWKIEVSPSLFKPLPLKTVQGGDLHWVRMSSGDILPDDAFIGGFEGEALYVARAYHNQSLCPGKYVHSLRTAFIPWGGEAHEKDQFEILCGYNAQWIPTSSNYVPPHAFPGGIATETRNEVLFIGRAFVDNHLIPGKVHLAYKTCYLPQEDKEIEEGSYEILVVPDNLPSALLWQPQINLNCSD